MPYGLTLKLIYVNTDIYYGQECAKIAEWDLMSTGGPTPGVYPGFMVCNRDGKIIQFRLQFQIHSYEPTS